MPYTKKLIETLLQTHIETDAANPHHNLQVIPYQNLEEPLTLIAAPNNIAWKKCYLLSHTTDIYHALIINTNTCTYISATEQNPQDKLAKLIPAIYQVYGNTIKFSVTNLKLSVNNAATGFIETLRQLLTQEKIHTIDIQAALMHDTAFYLNQLQEKKPEIIDSLRLIYLHSQLIQLLNTQPLPKLIFLREKSNFYKKNFSLCDYLKILSTESLFEIINTTSPQNLLSNLNSLRNKCLENLLLTETKKFSKPTTQQKLLELLSLLYHTSTIGLYGELAIALPVIFQSVTAGNIHRKFFKQITFAHLCKTIGIVTGTYLLIDAGFYYAIRSPTIYFSSQFAMYHLNTEIIDDKNGKIIEPYLNYSLDSSDWYLLISNLFLLAEALWSEDPKSPVYTIFAIVVNLLFTQLAKRFLPIFKDNFNSDNTTQIYTRMTLLMLISLGSRLFSNAIVNYGYAKADEQALCTAAQNQFKASIEAKTSALEMQCHSGGTFFWRSPPKLNAHATNKQGKTLAIECDIPLENCEVVKEYEHKLLLPN